MMGYIIFTLWLTVWIGFSVYGSKKKWSRTISVGGGFLLACFTSGIINGAYHNDLGWDAKNLITPLIIISIIAILALIYGYINRCPKCNKWFSTDFDGEEEIDRSVGYATIDRVDITKNTSGKEISRTTRKEQVRVIYYKYRNYYSCPACKHKWAEISEERVEG